MLRKDNQQKTMLPKPFQYTKLRKTSDDLAKAMYPEWLCPRSPLFRVPEHLLSEGSDFKAKGGFETALQWTGLVSEDKLNCHYAKRKCLTTYAFFVLEQDDLASPGSRREDEGVFVLEFILLFLVHLLLLYL
ncbi:hypothetical protein llap_10063 [Limosa lapponica baueri]|uniref:Uncharacterized protein n=1 Tax=Limosa lapponica baueri TaxID=1758121 RepID=A0A2I0U0T4_LIMLA|nr:hypothetical protein llap_10063 [Limosa lapponica baueri]